MKHVRERRGILDLSGPRRLIETCIHRLPTQRTRGLKEDSCLRKKKDEILHDHNHDGIDRRGFLKCMAWAGTGALCVMQGGVLKSYAMSRIARDESRRTWPGN